jgi:protein-disulfide isomerase
MPSGRASRTARRLDRVPPPPRSPAAGRRRQASPRVLTAAAAVVVAIAVAAVLVVVLSRGSSSSLTNAPAVGSITNGLPGAADVQTLFEGIPQHGTTLGRQTAPVTMVEYVDLQCPYCQQFETGVLPDIVKKYVRAGTLKIELRPWAFIGPDSVRGQAAVLAAAQQNKAFNYAAILYDNQGTENTGWLDDGMVAKAAASIPGLRVHQLLTARNSATVEAAAQKVAGLVKTDNVSSTPTILVGKTGTHGTVVNLAGPTDEQTLVTALDAAQH